MRRKYALPSYAAFCVGMALFGLSAVFDSNRYGRTDLDILLACVCGVCGSIAFYMERWRDKKNKQK